MNRYLFLFIFLITESFLCAVAQDHVFKEYDIRAIIGKEMEVEDAYEIGNAIAKLLNEKNNHLKTIALGADGRIHSPMIKHYITKALVERGINVIDIGTCSTPVMYFATYKLDVDAGLMVTASHNPGEYNGVKMRLGTTALLGQDIQTIREYYKEKNFLPKAEKLGKVTEIDLISQYVDYIASLFPDLVGEDIHAILDCGNGAAGTILPALIKKMEWKNVELLFGEVDGFYPNHIADPIEEHNMKDLKVALENSDAEVGLGFDGDADRMAPMTKSGRLVKGDQLLALYSQSVLEEFPGCSIVFDISSSRSLFDVVRKMGGNPVISSTGVACVKRNIDETNAKLGGEMSCHTIFNDGRWFGFDDGIYSMMRLFEMLQITEKTLDELVDELPVTFTSPLYRINCEREKCLQIVEKLKEHFRSLPNHELITIDGVRIHLPNGWAIVRASNTTPVISIRFEGNSLDDLDAIKSQFCDLMSQDLDCSEIMTR